MTRLVIAVASLSGCPDAGAPAMSACAGLPDRVAQEDCRLEAGLHLRADRARLEAAVAEIPDRDSRDLVRLRLALTDPVSLGWLCKDAEGSDIRLRCKYVVERPHLRVPRAEQ